MALMTPPRGGGLASTAGEPPALGEEIVYPYSDGEPLAETPRHADAMAALVEMLRDLHVGRDDVFVCMNSFWYYEEGNPAARRAPDVMLVRGVPDRRRNSFFSWREPVPAPQVIFEATSAETADIDLGEKRTLYERLGVREYYLFDPDGEFLDPPLQGFHLVGRRYRALRRDRQGRLKSAELGVLVLAEGRFVRFQTPAGEPILNRLERAAAERAARRKAEADKRQAEAEKRRAEADKRRADQQLAHLQAWLAEQGIRPPPAE